jgi:CHAT domain-containing protein
MGGGSHTYTVTLSSGQFVYIVVNQQGIDVVVTLQGPDGKPIAEVDGPTSMHGPERLAHITETPGAYRLVIGSYSESAPVGRYQVTIEALREPTNTDRMTVEAQNLTLQAQQLWAKGTADAAREALPKLEKSLALWKTVGDRRGEADALWYMAHSYNYVDDLRKSLAVREQELVLRHALGDVRVEASTLTNIAVMHRSLGDYQKAFEYQARALQVAAGVDDYEERGTAFQHLGVIYFKLGDSRRALGQLEKALGIHKANGFREAEIDTLSDIGNVRLSLGEHELALPYFEQALVLARSGKTPRRARQQATALYAIARVRRSLGDPHAALAYFEQALAVSREAGWRSLEAAALTDLGRTHASLGFADKAEESFHEALAIQRAIRDHEFEAVTLTAMARLASERGNLTIARERLETALDIVESVRSNVTQEALRTSYRASRDEPYEMYVDLLMRLQTKQPSGTEAAAALEASERWRARSLLEMLTEAHADIREGVDEDLLQRERLLQEQINITAGRQTLLLSARRTGPAEVAEKQLDALLSEYRQVQGEIRARSPRYAALTQPRQLSVTEIQREVLDETSMLLEYSLGPDRSYLWAVTPASFTSHVLPARGTIEVEARRLYELLTARNQLVAGETTARRAARLNRAEAEYWKTAESLSRMVLGPVAGELGTKRLIIVGDGALQYIPFSALPMAGTGGTRRPLIVDHEVVRLPSASVLSVLRRELDDRPLAPKMVAVLADPVFRTDDPRLRQTPLKSASASDSQPGVPAEDRSSIEVQRSASESGLTGFERLRFSRQEADAVAALAPADAILKATDFAASRKTATSPELGSYRIVHFATHGLINNQNPELSGIVLSLVDESGRPQDGFFRLHDIYNLKLGADLVVLSACRTALGKEIRGEGLVGLTRGFMYAGAPRVLASLWNVDDRATAQLMRQLYVAVLRDGQSPAAALRAAQVAMWKSSRWQSPYYWAAFVMQGEWR